MDSILTSIKKMLGISKEDTYFDSDIIIHINTVFMTLTQIGIGPSEGFSIQDEFSIWSDFIGEDPRMEAVKLYVYLKVRLMFDPPSSSVIEAMNRTISELEWRLNVQCETDSGGD